MATEQPTKMQEQPTREGKAVAADPLEVVGRWLENLMDPTVVNSVVAPDATYVSLNSEDSELTRIMPWAGTSQGPQAFLDSFSAILARFEKEPFNVSTMFESDENVAVFGDFRYRSKSLGEVVATPFSILAKVVDGKVTYFQFLEDSHATAASFRRGGSWSVQTEPGADPFDV